VCGGEMAVDPYEGGVVHVRGIDVVYSYMHGIWIFGGLFGEV
jgi:hypothetical protein